MSARRFACLVFVLVCLVPSAAFAASVRWTLSDVRFADGGTASGWFVQDADTQLVSAWSINTAGGDTTAFPPQSYSSQNGQATSDNGFGNPQPTLLFELTDSQRMLRMTPNAALTNAGGPVALNLDTAGDHSGGLECFNCGPSRIITAGNLRGVQGGPPFVGSGITGNWYNAAQNGHGVQFEVLPGGVMTAIWFAFDNAGNQAWISGAGTIEGDSVTMNAGRVLAGRFPPNFNPNTVERRPWGTLKFTFTDCNNGSVEWTSTDAAFTASGSLALTRLTSIDGLTCP